MKQDSGQSGSDAPEPPESSGGQRPVDPKKEPRNELPLSCDEARRQISYLIEDGDLKEAERMLLFGHINNCTSCKSELDRRRQLEARLKSAFGAIDTNPYFTQDVLDGLPPEKKSSRRSWFGTGKKESARSGSDSENWNDYSDYGTGKTKRLTLRWLRAYQLPLAVFTVILAASLAVAKWRNHIVSDPAFSPPIVSTIQGNGSIIHNDQETTLTAGTLIRRGDVIEAATGPEPLALTLISGNQPLGRIILRPGAQLMADNRHHYKIRQGDAVFEVRRDRPRQEGERFSVSTPLGHVQVLGTTFQVMVPSLNPRKVTVAVKTGVVDVRPSSGQGLQLQAEEEVDLLENGGVSRPRSSDIDQRMAWLFGGTIQPNLALNNPYPNAPSLAVPSVPSDPSVPSPSSSVRGLPAKTDWNYPIEMNFRGLTFSDALERISAEMGGLEDLNRMVKDLRASKVPEPPLTLVLHRPMPLFKVLRWLGRESGWRFDRGSVSLIRATHENSDILWPAESGLPPNTFVEHLEKPLPLAFGAFAGAKPESNRLSDGLANLAASAQENLLLSAEARAQALLLRQPLKQLTVPDHEDGEQDSFTARLHACLENTGLTSAWYDGLWYVAPKQVIEKITWVYRIASSQTWVGHPHHPLWSKSFKQLASRLAYSDQGSFIIASTTDTGQASASKPLARAVSLNADARQASYQAGLNAHLRFEEFLDLLEAGTPTLQAPAVELNEYRYSGAVKSIEDLIKAAAKRNVRIHVNGEVLPFEKYGFRNRVMPLGKALEWATRLNGLGLRAEGGHWIVDTWDACYGRPQLRVLNLDQLSLAAPQFEAQWPEWFAQQLQHLYPEQFKKVECYLLKNRLVFSGNRFQCVTAQRLLVEVEEALRENAKNEPPIAFELEAWKPAWRRRLENNLKAPYTASQNGKLPSGSFTGLLRAQFIQLPSSILVDPASLKAADTHAKIIKALDVNNLTVGEVLEKLARVAGLRTVLEGEVVWLKK